MEISLEIYNQQTCQWRKHQLLNALGIRNNNLVTIKQLWDLKIPIRLNLIIICLIFISRLLQAHQTSNSRNQLSKMEVNFKLILRQRTHYQQQTPS